MTSCFSHYGLYLLPHLIIVLAGFATLTVFLDFLLLLDDA